MHHGACTATAKRSEHANAAVAHLVTTGLDDDIFIARNAARRSDLIFQIAKKIFSRGGVEAVLFDKLAEGNGPRQTQKLATHLADLSPELHRPAGGVASPEWHFAGFSGSRRNVTLLCEISSMRQVDAPRTMVSPLRLSKTISSSSSPTRAPFVAPARNTPYRPRSGIVPPLMIATRCDPWRGVSVFATRSQVIRGRKIGKLVRGIAPRKHVENAFKDGSRERRIGSRRADEIKELIDRANRPARRPRRSVAREHPVDFAGSGRDSTWPWYMARVMAAHATRSARYFGKMTALLTGPT